MRLRTFLALSAHYIAIARATFELQETGNGMAAQYLKAPGFLSSWPPRTR